MKRLVILLLCAVVHADLYVAEYNSDLQTLADSRPDVSVEQKGGVAQVVTTSPVAKAELLHVAGILEPDNVFTVSLDDSVAQMGGPVSVGAGADTVSCIIDTGINYSLPQFGSCTAAFYALNGTNISQTVESDHPYSNNENVTYTITVPGAESVAVHFVNISLESFTYDNLDRVSVLDENNVTVAVYKDSVNNTWSPSVDGDTLRVQLTSDGSIQGYGFYIDTVLNGTSALTMNWAGCRVLGGYDFVNNDVDPRDDHGHGTHVAGIVASEDATYTGVSSSSDLLVAKALNASGSGYTSDIIEAVEWCTQQNAYYNVTSIVMSLGDGGEYNTYCSGALSTSIDAAVAEGITVTVAAGNEGYTAGISSPACVESALPVGAVDTSDNVVYNRGNILNILAPGTAVVSAWYGGGSVGMSGTSMATPHVAGAINLFQSWWYSLFGEYKSPAYLEARLNTTGDTIYDAGSDRNYSRVNLTNLFTPSMAYVGGSETVNVSVRLPVEFSVEWNLSTFLHVNYSNGTNARYNGSSYNITSNQSQSATYYAESSDGANSWYLDTRSVTFMVGPLITDNTDRVCSACVINTSFDGSNISVITLNISNSTWYTNFSYAPLNDTYTVQEALSLDDGVYNVTLRSNDSVGSSNFTFQLIVDTVPPRISELNVTAGPYYSGSVIVFNVSATGTVTLVTDETGENVSYAVSDSINTSSRLNHVTANYTFTVTDDAGNTESNLTQLFITNRNVDSVTINEPSGSIELGDATILNASAVDPDNDTLSYLWSYANQSANGSYTTMVFDTIGNITLTVNASDVNSSVAASSVFYVNDTVDPIIVSDTIDTSYHLAYGDVEFNVTYLENSGLKSAIVNISGTTTSYDEDTGTVLVFTPSVVVGSNAYTIILTESSFNRTVNQTGTFTVETCSDGVKNGPEYGIDCGGACPGSCSTSSSSGGGGGGGSSSSSSTSVSVSRTTSSSSVPDVKESSPVKAAAPVAPVVPQNIVEQINFTKDMLNGTLVVTVFNESRHTVDVSYDDGIILDIYVNGTLFGNVTVSNSKITFFAGAGEYRFEPREIEVVAIEEPKISVWEQDWFGWGMSNAQKLLFVLSIVLTLLGGLYHLIKPKELF